MFSDETRVKCPSCGKYVQSDEVPSCVQWCTGARECLGEQRWKELMGDAGDKQKGDADG
jgi:endogenous inhibitor of DNA gyrase (YacG/DUF329 family)